MNNRNIKFRAWDGYRNEMYPVSSIEWKDGTVRKAIVSPRPEFAQMNYAVLEKDLGLMQYTGLNDKNGVEIYEGDLLAVGGKGQAIDMKWNNDLQGWSPKVLQGDTAWKIIGNIYENPELLTNPTIQ